MINPNSTIMLMVMPMIPRIRNVMNIDIGIAIPTNIELRVPIKSRRTITTTITPEMILFSILLTISLVKEDWSFVMLILSPGGKRVAFASSRIA